LPMTLVPIEEKDIPVARAIRMEFARFWSIAKGHLEDAYDQFVAATPRAPEVTTREVSDDPGPGWWYEPIKTGEGRAILYLHGGGYFVGHARAYHGFVSQIVARADLPAFALEYPLSSKVRLPAVLDLAVGALERLASKFASVAVMGDSAGGGLALAAALEARRRDVPISAIVAFSPWTDLTFSGASAREMAVGDPLLDPAYLRLCAAHY